MSSPFHLAFPVRELESTRAFYTGLLGCREGRADERWVDFDLEGHQLSALLAPEACQSATDGARNFVDGDGVPVRHFGLVLPWQRWEELSERLRAADVSFLLEPRVRFAGQVGEQGTFFVQDPSGNALEFKSFRDPVRLFASDADTAD